MRDEERAHWRELLDSILDSGDSAAVDAAAAALLAIHRMAYPPTGSVGPNEAEGNVRH